MEREFGIKNKKIYIIYFILACISFAILVMLLANGLFNTYFNWLTYFNAFKLVSIILVLLYIVTRLDGFKRLLTRRLIFKDEVLYMFIFGILGILATYLGMDYYDVLISIRNLLPTIGGLLGGPIIGTGAGLIAGIYRVLMGDSLAVAGGIATIFAGLIASIIYSLNDGKFIGVFESVCLAGLLEGLRLFIYLMLPVSGYGPALSVISSVWAPVTFANMIAMLIFVLMIFKDIKYYNT